MGVEALSSCLWEQREALEELAYRLEAELLMVTSGRFRWLPRTTTAVEDALAQLAEVEARRGAASAVLAAEVGLAPDANLEALACALPDSAEALRSHRRHLQELLHEVENLAEATRRLLARNLAATTDALAMLGVEQGYGPDPMRSSSALPPRARAGGAVLVDARA